MVSLKKFKCEPVLKNIGDVEIYNLNHKDNADRRLGVLKYIHEKITNKEIDVAPIDVIKIIVPFFTNIEMDGLTDYEIKDISESPSGDLIEIINVVNTEFLKVVNELDDMGKAIANMTPDERKIFEEKLKPITQKEKQKQERLEKLKQIEEQRKLLEQQEKELLEL